MKKTLLSFGFGAMLAFNVIAQDVDYTHLIINNSFEYAWEGQLAGVGDAATTANGWVNNNSWRPWAGTHSHREFYGWSVTDWNFKSASNNAQSLEKSANPKDGDFNIAIFGNLKFGELWELYQVIDKDALPAGTYKIQARLAVDNAKRTTQRLFANQNVQYHGVESQYVSNLTEGEVNTFAGYPGTANALTEMTVFTTIGEDESLKIGIRTGGKKSDGTMAADVDPLWGNLKADYFRLTKINDLIPYTKLTSLNLNDEAGMILSPAFSPEITSYTAYIPAGTTTVTPTVTALAGSTITGAEAVSLSEGTGTSTITVTAPDRTSTSTYTINYIVAGAVDYTHFIVNNSFEYAWEGQLAGVGDAATTANGWTNNTWRPWAGTHSHREFYGWNVTDWNFKSEANNSQSLEKNANPKDGNLNIAIFGNLKFDELWELYQVIDKDALPAGTYKIQARLAVNDNRRTTQRLFANQNVQYHGVESQYVSNLTESEVNTFAGHPGTENALFEMAVYTTISEDESLKIGIRTGGKKSDGTMAADAGSSDPLWGNFKADYFRVTKLDLAQASDATLNAVTLNTSGTFIPDFDPQIVSYMVQLPKETTTVTPTAVPTISDVKVTGVEAIDVSSGTGVSTITVTALDGTTTKTYAINYTVGPVSNVDKIEAKATYLVIDRKLTVTGTDAYTVYSINGVKIAEVRHNVEGTALVLPQGIYIVKTAENQTLKAIVR